MLRKFEHPGPPRRFWQVDYRTPAVMFRWHTEGRLEQQHLRPFSYIDDATLDAEQEIARRLAQGFVEVGKPVPPDVLPFGQPKPEPTTPAVVIARAERFVAHVGQVQRFIAVVQEGTQVVVTSGVAGDTAELDIPDDSARRITRHTTIAEANSSYVEAIRRAGTEGFASANSRPPPSVRTNPELEADCLAHDSPETWAVYADWLIAENDPRGEIAQLSLAGQADAANRVLAANLDLLGDSTRAYDLRFRHGFARGVTLVRDPEHWDSMEGQLHDRLRDFLARPIGRFIDDLRFGLAGFSDGNDWAPSVRVAIELIGPRLRELRFDAWEYSQSEISWIPFGDLGFAWSQLPALEVLHIKSGRGGKLGGLELPRLKTFIRESGGLAETEIKAVLDALRSGHMPMLEHLELWFGSPNYGATGSLPMIRPILDGVGLERLRHLGIVNCAFVDDVVDALALSRILPQLDSLDLSRGTLAERGTEFLVAHAPAFRHLASIDLSRNLLVASEVAQIRAVLDNVIVVDQRERDDTDEDDDDGYRYVAVGE
jgi:predicted DNA-binding WGR domain protein